MGVGHVEITGHGVRQAGATAVAIRGPFANFAARNLLHRDLPPLLQRLKDRVGLPDRRD